MGYSEMRIEMVSVLNRERQWHFMNNSLPVVYNEPVRAHVQCI